MSTPGSVSEWIEELKTGNSSAATNLWNRYHARLLGFARNRIRRDARRVTDEEDLVATAFGSFFCRAVSGQFPELAGRQELWTLLVTITDRKVVNAIRRHLADKRGGGRVHGEIPCVGEDDAERIMAGSGNPLPLPDFVASLSELMESLDDWMRQVVSLRMDGYSNDEIGQRLNRSAATIERRLRLLRDQWLEELLG